MAKSKKLGRLTTEEWEYIRKHHKTSTVDAIADHLGRRPESVADYITSHLGSTPKVKDKFNLKDRKYWPNVKKQLSEDEIPLFEFEWEQIIKIQFNKDVLYTEELQVVDAIRQGILCNRSLAAQQETADTIQNLSEELTQAKMSDNDELIFNLERQIAVLRAAQDTMSKDYKSYLDGKMKLFDKIKGSRDNRIHEIEDRKETFATLSGRLKKDPAFAEQCSLDMEKMRLSMKMHLKKLGDYHEFESSVDRPILNEKTVFFESKDDEEEV